MEYIYKKLWEYCSVHDRIYIYGAGIWGCKCYRFLMNNGVKVSGFIVTKKKESRLFALPIYSYDEFIVKRGNYGIILAMGKKNFQDMKMNNTLPEDCFYMGDNDVLENIKKHMYELDTEIKKGKLISRDKWGKILIVQIEITFGDLIWSTAFLRELRKNHPCATITMIVNTSMAELLSTCPYVDNVLEYPSSNHIYDYYSKEMENEVRAFYSKNFATYDVVFLLRRCPCQVCDIWPNVLLRIYSRASIGFGHIDYFIDNKNIWTAFYNQIHIDIVVHSKNTVLHESQRKLCLLEKAGDDIKDDKMELWPSNRDESEVKKKWFYDSSKYYIAVGLVGTNQNRSWSPTKYNHVFKRLIEDYNADIVFVFIGDGDAAKKSYQLATDKLEKNCVNLIGKTTLNEAAFAIKKCSFYIGSNTGLLHMASAVGVPVIELSASLPDALPNREETPQKVGAWRVPSISLLPEKGLDGCTGFCRKNYAHCINQIREESVYQAILEFINKF